jgi:hypothetical protein
MGAQLPTGSQIGTYEGSRPGPVKRPGKRRESALPRLLVSGKSWKFIECKLENLQLLDQPGNLNSCYL